MLRVFYADLSLPSRHLQASRTPKLHSVKHMCADLPTEDVLPILGHAQEVCHGSFNNILAANEFDAIGLRRSFVLLA